MSALAANPLPTPIAKLRNILYATDFSDASMRALPCAAGIAKKLGASLYLCHIVEPSALVNSAPGAAPGLYERMRNQATSELASLAHSPELKDLDAKTMVGTGAIGDALPNVVVKNKIDLIVMGTHGRTGVRRLLLGSAVEAVCRVATCPVLTVGPSLSPNLATAFGRILFPTDLSEDSKRILPHLRQVAEEYQSEITILRVMPEELATNPDAANLAEPIRRSMIDTLERELAGMKVEFMIGFGETVETVLRTARAKKIDLITMGIHNAFLPGVQLRSSTAYRIMAGAHCPVLTYRHLEGEP
jgi:nucleotide-binding universal stress UspA family protein